MTVLCPHCHGRLMVEGYMREPCWLCLCCGRRYPLDRQLRPAEHRPLSLPERTPS